MVGLENEPGLRRLRRGTDFYFYIHTGFTTGIIAEPINFIDDDLLRQQSLHRTDNDVPRLGLNAHHV